MDDVDIFRTGLFALKYAGRDFLEMGGAATLATATCQIDLMGQLVVRLQVLLAEGGGMSNDYSFEYCLYLRHDRITKRIFWRSKVAMIACAHACRLARCLRRRR